MENNRRTVRSIFAFLSLVIFIILGFIAINGVTQEKTYGYSEIVEYFKKHEVTEYDMNLGSGDMNIKLKNGDTIRYSAPSVNLMYADIKDYVTEYNKENPEHPMKYNLGKPQDMSWLVSLLGGVVLPVALLCFVGWMFMDIGYGR